MAFERALIRASRQAFSLKSTVSVEHRILSFAFLQGSKRCATVLPAARSGPCWSGQSTG